MNEIEIRNVDGVQIVLAPSALQLRDSILEEARGIVALEDAPAEQRAVAIVGRMNGFAKALEACRKAVKAPVLALGEKIDAIAESALSDLAGEKERVSGLLAEAQAKRDAVLREQEAKRQREQERIEAEERRLAEERRKAEQEALDRQNTLKSEAGRKRAAEEAEARRVELDKQQSALAASRAKAEAPVAEPEKAKGSIVREVFNVEVLDAAAVYRWNPLYVKLVPELAMLKKVAERGEQIPGCRITKETKVSVRSVGMEATGTAPEEVPG